MKRIIYWTLPPNIFAWLFIGLFSLVDATLAKENPMGFGLIVLVSYGLVIGTIMAGLIMIGFFHFLEWLDDWSGR